MISSCSGLVFRSELSRASYCRWTIPRHCRLGRCECVARLSRTVCADPNDGNPWRDTGRNRHFTRIRNRVAGNDYPGSAAKSVLAVAGVTIAHGSDNIAIYVPILATQTTVGIFTTVAVFFLLTGVWLVLARWFVRHPALGASCPIIRTPDRTVGLDLTWRKYRLRIRDHRLAHARSSIFAPMKMAAQPLRRWLASGIFTINSLIF
jgi:hypothetical protein